MSTYIETVQCHATSAMLLTQRSVVQIYSLRCCTAVTFSLPDRRSLVSYYRPISLSNIYISQGRGVAAQIAIIVIT